jgi:hypothetical protein
MGNLELSLQLPILLIQLLNLGIARIIRRNIQWHQVLRQIGPLLMQLQIHKQVVVNGIDDLPIAIDKAVLPVRVECGLVGQHLQELRHLEDDLLFLGLLGVDHALGVQVFEDVRQEVAQLEGVELVQSDEGQVLVEGLGVEQGHDLFDLLRADGGFLRD